MFYTRDYKLLGKDLRGVGSLTFMFIHHTLGEAWLIPQGFSPILSFPPNCDGYGSLGEKIHLKIGKSSFILLFSSQFLWSVAISLD